MKKVSTVVVVCVMGLVIMPQIALASWWNPFTWSIFRHSPPVTSVEPVNVPNVDTPPPQDAAKTDDGWAKLIRSNSSQNDIAGVVPDESVIKSSLQIRILDKQSDGGVGGTGIAIGGFGAILTNYHVAKDFLTNPSRYTAYACESVSVNTDPDCKYLLRTTDPAQALMTEKAVSQKYSKELDLALLYIDKVKVGSKWESVFNTPMNTIGFNVVNLSSYIDKVDDLHEGDSVFSVGYPDYGDNKTIRREGAVTQILVDPQDGKIGILNSIDISHGNSGGPVFNARGQLVGVTVACLTASRYTDACKENSGIFIPLPIVNGWYTKQTNSKIASWEGSRFYVPKGGSSSGVMGSAWCSAPLRQNAHYDPNISADSCTCNTGFTKNSGGDCVDSSGAVDPKLRYGKPADPEAEKRAMLQLQSLLSGGTPATSPAPATTNALTVNQQQMLALLNPLTGKYRLLVATIDAQLPYLDGLHVKYAKYIAQLQEGQRVNYSSAVAPVLTQIQAQDGIVTKYAELQRGYRKFSLGMIDGYNSIYKTYGDKPYDDDFGKQVADNGAEVDSLLVRFDTKDPNGYLAELASNELLVDKAMLVWSRTDGSTIR